MSSQEQKCRGSAGMRKYTLRGTDRLGARLGVLSPQRLWEQASEGIRPKGSSLSTCSALQIGQSLPVPQLPLPVSTGLRLGYLSKAEAGSSPGVCWWPEARLGGQTGMDGILVLPHLKQR